MNFGIAARIIAATLALVAAIYTITTFLVKSKVEVYEEWGEHIEERLDKLDSKVFPDDEKKEKKSTKE